MVKKPCANGEALLLTLLFPPSKPEDTNNSTAVETQRLSRDSDGNGRRNNNHINGDDVRKVCKPRLTHPCSEQSSFVMLVLPFAGKLTGDFLSPLVGEQAEPTRCVSV